MTAIQNDWTLLGAINYDVAANLQKEIDNKDLSIVDLLKPSVRILMGTHNWRKNQCVDGTLGLQQLHDAQQKFFKKIQVRSEYCLILNNFVQMNFTIL